MVSWMRRRLTYANVLVTALAFLVLAGTSLAQDAVSSAASLITGKQVKNGSLTGKDVKNHSLTKKDFKGSVRGPRGIQGPQGIQGVQGVAGAPGATNVTVHTAATVVTSGSTRTVYAFCPAGERAVGGGAAISNSAAFLVASRPSVRSGASAVPAGEGEAPDSWTAVASHDPTDGTTPTVSAYVVCAAP